MVEVRQSTVIDAPVEEVWRIIRDFNGHDRWHPAVAASQIEGGAPVDMIGAVRNFRLASGAQLREQLLSLSDEALSFSYCILEAPLPLMGYVASVRLKPVTDGNRTFWEWRSRFQPPAERREELVRLVRDDIYRAGFAAVRKMLAGGGRSPGHGPESISPPPLTPPHKREGDMAAPTPALPFHARVQPRQDRREGDAARPTPPSPLWGGVRGGDAAPPVQGDETTSAILVERHGGPEVLESREIPLPPPGPGEVRIRHTAIGVNFIDVYCRTGYFDLLQPPGVPGMEAAGIVESLGETVRGLSVGDRVAYACPPVGAYAERRNMAPDLLVPLPRDIRDETAAAGLLKGVTASFLLHDVHPVRAGQVVLVHAAAGGVGQLLVQWARALGAVVIATTSSVEKAQLVERLGADHVVIYTRESFPDAVQRLTDGRGADVIYDAVGRDSFEGSLACLAVRGHLVSFGQASGPVGSWDIGRFASKSVTISRPNYAHYTDTPEKLRPHVERFFGALRQRIVTLADPTLYPLAEAAAAHRDLEARRTTGSLVLIP